MNFVLMSAKAFSVLVLFIAAFNLSDACHYAVMKAESSGVSDEFCIHSELYPSYPEHVAEAKPLTLEIDDTGDWCTDDSKTNASDKVLLLPAGNCSISAQVQNFYLMSGRVILFVHTGSLRDLEFFEKKYLNGTGIPAIKISKSSANELKKMGNIITIRLLKPQGITALYILITLGIIAVFTVAAGSYMSGFTSYKIFRKQVTKENCTDIHAPDVIRTYPQPKNMWCDFLRLLAINIELGEEYGIPIIVLTPCNAIYLIVASLFLFVVGYFLKDYVVIFSIHAFTFMSILLLYFCLYSWTRKLKTYFFKYTFTVCNIRIVISGLSLILLTVSLGLPIIWLKFRKAKHAWVLLNFLNMIYCFGVLRLFRLSSLKVCTVLLSLLFILGIFCPIVTPFFTKNGNSVMGEVATGGNLKRLYDANFKEEVAAGRGHIEFMPAFLQMKEIGFDPYRACYQMCSAIGLGDIVLPALLLSYCYAFDLCSNNKMFYYPVSVISFALGLILSTLALIFWKSEQPALLFIVPSVLIPIVLLGWCRAELGTLWCGLKVIRRRKWEERNANRKNSKIVNVPLDQQAETT